MSLAVCPRALCGPGRARLAPPSRARCCRAASARRRVPPCAASPPLGPELLTLKSVVASASVAAALVTVFSLCSATGRARWAQLFSSWTAALPASPQLRRAMAWLPVIACAKALEGAFGLPVLNWVYVAMLASTAMQAISGAAAASAQRQAQQPSAPAGSVAPSAPASEAGAGGINALARSLFATRFPELAGETEVIATSPVMLSEAGGVQAQGQLYLTGSYVAFHGAFGRARRVVALRDVQHARQEAGAQKGRALSLLHLETASGRLTFTAVDALGGGDALASVASMCAHE